MAADYPMTVMPIVCSEEGTLCFYLNDRLVIGNRAKTELKNFHRRTILTSNNLHRVHDTHIFYKLLLRRGNHFSEQKSGLLNK